MDEEPTYSNGGYVKGAKATFTVMIEIDGMEDVQEAKERFATAMRQGSDMKDAFFYHNVEWVYGEPKCNLEDFE